MSPLHRAVREGPLRPGLPGDAHEPRARPGRERPHSARPRRPAAEEPARVRDRLRPAVGRAPDHARAGRAARLPGAPARGGSRAPLRRLDPDLPYTFRRLSRDHALTEIYSFLLESITREPGWHAIHFGLSDAEDAERAEAARFLEVLLFRRYAAKLAYELELLGRLRERERLRADLRRQPARAIGFRYRADGYLADMDGDFYSADYLRAWIRTAQLRAHLRERIGEDWWRRPETGEILRALRGGHAPDERGDRRPDRLRPARHRAAGRGAGDRLTGLEREAAGEGEEDGAGELLDPAGRAGCSPRRASPARPRRRARRTQEVGGDEERRHGEATGPDGAQPVTDELREQRQEEHCELRVGDAVSSPLAKSRLAGSRSAQGAVLPRSAWGDDAEPDEDATPAIFSALRSIGTRRRAPSEQPSA